MSYIGFLVSVWVVEVIYKKKTTHNWLSFCHGGGVIPPSPNKTIPCHLIISNHKYHVIELYIFIFVSAYILQRFIQWRLSIYMTDRFFSSDTRSPEFFKQ